MTRPDFLHSRFGMAIVLVVLTRGALNAQTSGFCTQLTTIVRAADSGFQALRGAPRETRLSNTRIWEAVTALPGATRCEVSVRSDRSTFNCTWNVADQHQLDEQYRTFVEAVPACFPNVSRQASEERADEFDPGELRPAMVRFRFKGDVSLSIRKWTPATTSTRSRISFSVTRG